MVTNTAEGGRTEVVFYTAKSNNIFFSPRFVFFSLAIDYLCEGRILTCAEDRNKFEIVLDRVSGRPSSSDLGGTTVGSEQLL